MNRDCRWNEMIEDKDYFVVSNISYPSEQFGITFISREDNLLKELSDKVLDKIEADNMLHTVEWN